MHLFSRNVTLRSVFTISVLLGLTGCSEPTAEDNGHSYVDLVTIYNAELQTLDRLERKREELKAKHETALGPSTIDATKALETILSSANEAGKQLDLNDVTDPNELLDRTVAHAEKTKDLTAELLESVSSATEPSEKDLQNKTKLTEQFEHKLAAIEKEIAEQKVRVDRARAERDAAEATRKR